METDRLVIRKFKKSDVDNLYKLLSDEDSMRYIEPPYSRERAVSFLDTAGLCDPPLILAVEDRQGNFVGYVIYHPYEKDSYEIGWILQKEHWHKGYAKELTKALIEDAKKKTKFLILECHPQQAATKRIALQNHFLYMGQEEGCDVYRLQLNGNVIL